MPAVSTDDLRKTYGRIEALQGVSISVEPGQIFGLLGQNGAGKSTLIKILLGIVKLTDGHAELLGRPAGNTEVRRRVGYLPEDHQFPQYHSAYSLLDIYGQMYGLSRPDRRKRAAEALDYVGLKKRADYKIRTYSKGMKQRLGIASAFFHDPEVIFLDEPTDGVDPVGRKEIRDLLLQLKGEGRTIFVNSHLLGEVEMISDRVAILHKGELKHIGTVAELTRQEGRFVVGLAAGQTFPADEVAKLGCRCLPAGDRTEVVVGDRPDAIDGVLALLQAKGLRVRHLVEQKRSLEDVFVGMVEKAADPGDGDHRPHRAVRKMAQRGDA